MDTKDVTTTSTEAAKATEKAVQDWTEMDNEEEDDDEENTLEDVKKLEKLAKIQAEQEKKR